MKRPTKKQQETSQKEASYAAEKSATPVIRHDATRDCARNTCAQPCSIRQVKLLARDARHPRTTLRIRDSVMYAKAGV